MTYAEQEKRIVQPGFTFMELVVAVLILGILASVAGFAYLQFVGTAKESATKASLKSVKSAIDLYHIQHNKYPTRLRDLVERPKGEIKGWKPAFEKMPKDGWGNEFYYKVTPGKKHPYELYSYGSEGPEGSAEERISVWDL
ncbi:MAG: type II secretion system major pseudopilin GspG [Candidatus Babeliales bacterium]